MKKYFANVFCSDMTSDTANGEEVIQYEVNKGRIAGALLTATAGLAVGMFVL